MTAGGRRTDCTLIVAAYDREAEATAAMAEIHRLTQSGAANLQGAAVVNRDPEGAISIPGMPGDESGRGAGIGALAGASVGVLFPPALLGSALLGGATGALSGHRRSRSMRAIADAISNTLPPASSGVIAITEMARMDDLDHVLSESRRVTKGDIDDAVVAKLHEVAGAV